MNRLNWFIARRFDHLPVLRLLAWLTMLLLLAVLGWFFMLLQTVPTETDKSTQHTAETITMVVPKQSSAAKVLSSAPKVRQVTHAIEVLYSVASKHGLNLTEVMYQNQDSQDRPLLLYAIDFTVEQQYPHIKAFITDLLQALPYLALEQVSFEREDINSNQIKSQLHFILFMDKAHE